MDFQNIKRVLVLAPHPDDGEFSSGGTIKRLSDLGIEVHYAAFSPCIQSLPEGLAEDTLWKELSNAAEILGVQEQNIHTFQFPVRYFPEHRQAILEQLILLKKSISPDLVLMPNSLDIHQDHNTIHKEGLRAFKHTRILGYELPWNNLNFTNNCHVRLERNHIKSKMEALQCYQSQNGRNYMDEEFFFGLAKTRGIQINESYAEAFELIRWIL
ncbi:MAG: PIG-L deacetylase family protein [Croceimicrobium sp.]|nr:PIG-L family deacetylase [Bacteroidota bacterium]